MAPSRFVQARAEVIVQDGQPRAMLSIIRDITERWMKERTQRDFLAMTSHELRNSLTIISGIAQLMRRRGVYDERALERIVSQAAHMERLLGDMLEVASLEAGRWSWYGVPSTWWRSSAPAWSRLGRRPTGTPSVSRATCDRIDGIWDADRLRQVVDNLLSNAIKYSPDGGEIVVRVEEIEADGAGVDPRPRRRYPRGSAGADLRPLLSAEGAATETNGFGIGLFVAKSIVELHGGHIDVASEHGRGSTFSFTLPSAR